MAGENSFQVICACGEKLRAPMSAIGKKGRCPGCGAAITLNPPAEAARAPVAVATAARAPAVAQKAAPVPAAAAPRASVPSGTGVSLDDLDDIEDSYDVAEDAVVEQPARFTLCPGCRSQMDSGAVLCVKCGYDTRTGKALATPKTQPGTSVGGNRGKPQIDRMAPQGSFYKGLLMSVICAAIASLVWILFAWATHFELRLIALLIGGAAGAGMKVGQDGFSAKGGSAAAGITALMILLAKAVVLELVIVIPYANAHPGLEFHVKSAFLGLYYLGPFSLIIMAGGMVFAFRTANGSFTA